MYIVFEGIDGTGKSTQIELVKERLDLIFKENCKEKIDVRVIAEPELDECVDEKDDVEIALRFALQREILLHKISKLYYSNPFDDMDPDIILSDRSYYSSLAYQTSYLYSNYIRDINTHIPEPTMIFFFDKGKSDNYHLEEVRQRYYKTLPLSTIIVDTKNQTVLETTEYIVDRILRVWNDMEFTPMLDMVI